MVDSKEGDHWTPSESAGSGQDLHSLFQRHGEFCWNDFEKALTNVKIENSEKILMDGKVANSKKIMLNDFEKILMGDKIQNSGKILIDDTTENSEKVPSRLAKGKFRERPDTWQSCKF